eukprot:GFYU01003229.1.p2 GENE.GFYU01003229.1~~GFYU01003229.1.p2  ORF type:complete len:122 (-),score=18.61 GFYU01003229.1:21-386(-)
MTEGVHRERVSPESSWRVVHRALGIARWVADVQWMGNSHTYLWNSDDDMNSQMSTTLLVGTNFVVNSAKDLDASIGRPSDFADHRNGHRSHQYHHIQGKSSIGHDVVAFEDAVVASVCGHG